MTVLADRLRAIVNYRYIDKHTKRELLALAEKVEAVEKSASPVADERNDGP